MINLMPISFFCCKNNNYSSFDKEICNKICIKNRSRICDSYSYIKKAASYSPALHCSTIGAGGLNFSVRNGKRWDPAAITT